jgi:diguanylate cyclase (GGDEF)-like protein/PAS domain S-box-containing protein
MPYAECSVEHTAIASEPATILVVDDEATMRRLLSRFLSLNGHQTLTASGGAEALALIRQERVNLVLLDLMMPGMTGIEVLRRLKADPELHDLPVIMISAEMEMDNVAECLKLGAEDYLPKPFNPVVLGARVSACLERQRLRAQEQAYHAQLERQVAERTAALAASEERYALAARGANDGLWDWELLSNKIYLSPRWKEMLGYEEHELGNDPAEWLQRIHPDDRELLEVRLEAHFQRLITHFQHEYRMMHRDGEYHWMLCRGLAVWNAEGRAVRVAGSQTDISERKQAEQRLLHDALHDGLTGLPNRALFLDRLKHVLSRTKRSADYHFAVMFLDLDRFKVINDSLGHSTGDMLLKAIAERLEECVRPGDTVARLGGDEFTILIDDIGSDQRMLDVAERVQQVISAPIILDGQQVFTTASIGVTHSTIGYDSASDLVRDADTAMYYAKLGGKAQAVVFDPAMHAAANERLQLESALRWAYERDELRLHYQPIVELATGRTVGLEALLRWQHPQRGLLFPASFIQVAEETGLIVPIGWWVLREACRQLSAWQQHIPHASTLWITVNISAKQLTQPNASAQIFKILEESGIDPTHLKLEITETTLLEHSKRTSEILQQIREAGIQVCMDDFGTGYSSLSYLQNLPIDVLKIDRSFIGQLGGVGERSEIVRTILVLAQTLGLKAVAEGTETQEQAEQLLAMQCEFGQGWLFSHALEPEKAEQLMQANISLVPR